MLDIPFAATVVCAHCIDRDRWAVRRQHQRGRRGPGRGARGRARRLGRWARCRCSTAGRTVTTSTTSQHPVHGAGPLHALMRAPLPRAAGGRMRGCVRGVRAGGRGGAGLRNEVGLARYGPGAVRHPRGRRWRGVRGRLRLRPGKRPCAEVHVRRHLRDPMGQLRIRQWPVQPAGRHRGRHGRQRLRRGYREQPHPEVQLGWGVPVQDRRVRNRQRPVHAAVRSRGRLLGEPVRHGHR